MVHHSTPANQQPAPLPVITGVIKIDLAGEHPRQAVFMLEQAPAGATVVIDAPTGPNSHLWPLVAPLAMIAIDRSLRLVFHGDQISVREWIGVVREHIGDQFDGIRRPRPTWRARR